MTKGGPGDEDICPHWPLVTGSWPGVLQYIRLSFSKCCDSNHKFSVCPSGWTYFKKQCYKYSKEPFNSWQEARDHCTNVTGADLASVPDERTKDFLVSLISSSSYIGGMQVELSMNLRELSPCSAEKTPTGISLSTKPTVTNDLCGQASQFYVYF